MSNQQEPSLISLRQISKSYEVNGQIVHALRHVDLTVHSGQIIAITGKSGAGKSTLLHLLGTLDRPTSGEMFIKGINLGLLSDAGISKFRNSTIGFVFQSNNLLPEFNALENVMVPARIAGLAGRGSGERARSLLRAVELGHRLEHRPAELSGGEQQRVAIARALMMAPSLLLADEPTGNLDVRTSLNIQEMLLRLCKETGTAMLLVTHDLELARRMPEQIVMEDGRIVKTEGVS